MKIGIVTDSVASLSQEDVEKYKIQVVPVNLLFEGKVYRDGVDLTTEQAYQILEKNPEEFATSAPAAGDFLKAYRQAASLADQIISLTVSQKLSATYDSARMAKGLFAAEFSQKKVEVIDTLSATVGQALLVLTTARLIDEGKDFDEIIKIIENLRGKIRTYLLLETIRYIYRTGRIPEVASKIGSIMPFKPILRISEGKVHFSGMAGSREKGLEKLINNLKENFDPNYQEIGITHTSSAKEAEELKGKIQSLFPQAKIFITACSPIIGYATGSGLLGIAFYSR
jgi:DegV family protein with EDD domain